MAGILRCPQKAPKRPPAGRLFVLFCDNCDVLTQPRQGRCQGQQKGAPACRRKPGMARALLSSELLERRKAAKAMAPPQGCTVFARAKTGPIINCKGLVH